jgi:ornithine cyclodeaminase/alanine dehydrogenase
VALAALREVRAYDLHAERAAAYAREMAASHPRLRFEPVGTPRDAVAGCDIVVTAGPILTQPRPAIEADWLAEGMLAVPLDYDSYFTPAAMRGADRFYTDDTRQLLETRAGGVFFQQIPEIYADLGEVLAGLKDARRSRRERLICMNLGIAMDDMATAPLVLERARALGLGTRLPL